MTILHLHSIDAANRPDTAASASCDRRFVLDAISPAGSLIRRLASLAVRRHIGMPLPRYWYHLGEVVHAAPTLNLFRREQVLLLGNDFTAAAELADIRIEAGDCTLEERAQALETLVRASLLLLDAMRAEQSEPIGGEQRVIAELPGLRLDDGSSPFWEGLGRFFHDADPDDAERTFGPSWRSHVAALMPRHPLVVSLLRPSAQDVIGQVASSASGMRDALVAQGFAPSRHVGIIDAGPVFCSEPRDREVPRLCEIRAGDPALGTQQCAQWLIRPGHVDEIWCLPAQHRDGGLTLAPALIELSGLQAAATAQAVARGE